MPYIRTLRKDGPKPYQNANRSKNNPKTTGFRFGRICTGQILNLCQHIEDGFENKKVTGTVFADLTAAYDMVNHNALLQKIYY